METSIIEKFDKSRYELIKWFTVGWIVWFGTFITKDFFTGSSVAVLLMLAGCIGWIFFIINLIKCVRIGKKINADSDLKQALNNEMHQFYKLNSFMWGFGMSIGTVCCLIIATSFYELSALLACEVILFAGITSSLIAHLIYNKE